MSRVPGSTNVLLVHLCLLESLELRLLEALAGVYPRTLNGAQLAKLCGHFKLKSKVRPSFDEFAGQPALFGDQMLLTLSGYQVAKHVASYPVQ